MTETSDASFPAVKLSARDKAAATDRTARAIIEAEASAREKKTSKLKALRLQQEAAAETARPPESGKPKRTRNTARHS